jgi:malonate-semialdehyde dehydrogenase (acetylating)/methylmalonate-semialdehyde dehydrogenase
MPRCWIAPWPQRKPRKPLGRHQPSAPRAVMFEFKRLVEANMQSLAELLASEHGKVVADAKGDIQRGLEVIEFACGIPHALKGEYTQGAGPGIDVYSMRQPIGIGAGSRLSTFRDDPDVDVRPGLACGNAFILKPSERDPSCRCAWPN